MNRQSFPCASSLCALALLVGVAGCGQSESAKAPASTNQGSSPLTAPVDYLGAIQKGQVTAEKTVDTVTLKNAIQMFGVEKGRNPKDLNELVEEKFLPALPKPPYGMQFHYDPETGKVTVVPKS